MAFKIGFTADHKRMRCEESAYQARQHTDAPHPSVVQVYFESRDRSWTYYNDRFDLHEGDLVYVEGKLEGVRGRVVEVSYNFRIKLADYKRVIAVADTAETLRVLKKGGYCGPRGVLCGRVPLCHL